MKAVLQIIPTQLLDKYLNQVSNTIQKDFDKLKDAEISSDTFSFYVSVSSVYSSKIEGEAIELDSYIKHKKYGVKFLPDYTKKIDDLYNAYYFTQHNEFNKKNTSKIHQLLSKHILTSKLQGTYRNKNMYVTTPDGKIEYVAALPNQVENEMQKFFEDVKVLLLAKLNIEEVFYFASFIHLIFVKIHPWNDGNGRTARLLEKWFIAQKLGHNAWLIQSEKMYYNQHNTYYNNIRLLGLEYELLNYNQALPFLLMLPNSLHISE